MINIVLLQPEIPQNTGNISRTCAVTASRLHLVKPLGFDISDRYLKRAGLDYWEHLDLTVYESTDDFFARNAGGEFHFFTTKAPKIYTDVTYGDEPYLIFGRETAGIDETILTRNLDRCVRIPMTGSLRSLNLSNSAAIAAYEVLRQRGFAGMKRGSEYFES
ncbi:putative tRNA (cytidine(34)-2'-O)-methyltransferase [Clostridia bacterium]|nr:putative tRNA (cytidine(34)-2'-O)-methyltransferase [Clostridia bacterium]GHU34866.1 putative tRNA (cytidine(34)-2'-O)-methyltransferase [Clostridia bacterium]